jgi:hypothetical protein
MKRVYKIGDIYTNKYGTSVEIIGYVPDKQQVIVSVVGTNVRLNVSSSTLKAGKYKTPMCRTVYGVGYFGQGKYNCRDESGKITPEYSAWSNMIKRCYTKYKGNRCQDLYENVKVCDEWLNFQTFAQWYVTNTERFRINNIIPKMDKDLLAESDRGVLYSPETVVLLPNVLNCNLVQKRITNKGHNGVNFANGKHTVQITFNYKMMYFPFTDEKEAIEFYLSKKKEFITLLANEYKHVLDDKTYNLLVNWKWRNNE